MYRYPSPYYSLINAPMCVGLQSMSQYQFSIFTFHNLIAIYSSFSKLISLSDNVVDRFESIQIKKEKSVCPLLIICVIYFKTLAP